MATRTFDPKKQLFSFLGNLITGFAPDTYIQVERNEDGFSVQVGAAGDVTRVRNNNRTGRVTITLMAASQSNDILSAIAAADELAGTGVGALFGKELNGTTNYAAANAWITKIPQTERQKEAGTVQWVFECEALEQFNGGLLS